jgi:Predicted metal-dependent phosphoesterases (PHP family)
MHSTFSDGLRSPERLLAEAAEKGLRTVALTDHDTAAGVPDMTAAAAGSGVTVVPGCELSTGQTGQIHLLLYGEGVLSPELTAFLARYDKRRRERARAILDRLEKLGRPLEESQRAAVLARRSPGRAHIAHAMAASGMVRSVSEAFALWLDDPDKAYIPFDSTLTADAVALGATNRCLPVLAHPMRITHAGEKPYELIPLLKEAGLRGVECRHPSANGQNARMLEEQCRSLDLLVTGGSDYHADGAQKMGHFGTDWSSWESDSNAFLEAVDALRKE